MELVENTNLFLGSSPVPTMRYNNCASCLYYYNGDPRYLNGKTILNLSGNAAGNTTTNNRAWDFYEFNYANGTDGKNFTHSYSNSDVGAYFTFSTSSYNDKLKVCSPGQIFFPSTISGIDYAVFSFPRSTTMVNLYVGDTKYTSENNWFVPAHIMSYVNKVDDAPYGYNVDDRFMYVPGTDIVFDNGYTFVPKATGDINIPDIILHRGKSISNSYIRVYRNYNSGSVQTANRNILFENVTISNNAVSFVDLGNGNITFNGFLNLYPSNECNGRLTFTGLYSNITFGANGRINIIKEPYQSSNPNVGHNCGAIENKNFVVEDSTSYQYRICHGNGPSLINAMNNVSIKYPNGQLFQLSNFLMGNFGGFGNYCRGISGEYTFANDNFIFDGIRYSNGVLTTNFFLTIGSLNNIAHGTYGVYRGALGAFQDFKGIIRNCNFNFLSLYCPNNGGTYTYPPFAFRNCNIISNCNFLMVSQSHMNWYNYTTHNIYPIVTAWNRENYCHLAGMFCKNTTTAGTSINDCVFNLPTYGWNEYRNSLACLFGNRTLNNCKFNVYAGNGANIWTWVCLGAYEFAYANYYNCNFLFTFNQPYDRGWFFNVQVFGQKSVNLQNGFGARGTANVLWLPSVFLETNLYNCNFTLNCDLEPSGNVHRDDMFMGSKFYGTLNIHTGMKVRAMNLFYSADTSNVTYMKVICNNTAEQNLRLTFASQYTSRNIFLPHPTMCNSYGAHLNQTFASTVASYHAGCSCCFDVEFNTSRYNNVTLNGQTVWFGPEVYELAKALNAKCGNANTYANYMNTYNNMFMNGELSSLNNYGIQYSSIICVNGAGMTSVYANTSAVSNSYFGAGRGCISQLFYVSGNSSDCVLVGRTGANLWNTAASSGNFIRQNIAGVGNMLGTSLANHYAIVYNKYNFGNALRNIYWNWFNNVLPKIADKLPNIVDSSVAYNPTAQNLNTMYIYEHYL